MAKYLNDTGLVRVWGKFKSWATNTFAPLTHDHVSVTGNAGSATKLENARVIALTGGVTGSTSFDGSGNTTISSTLNLEGFNEGVLPIRYGGTGAVTASSARKALKIQCGVVHLTIPSLSSSGYASFDVQFPTEFAWIPIVVLTGVSNTSGRVNGLVMNVGNRTTSGFSIDAYNATAGSSGAFGKSVMWIAIEDL